MGSFMDAGEVRGKMAEDERAAQKEALPTQRKAFSFFTYKIGFVSPSIAAHLTGHHGQVAQGSIIVFVPTTSGGTMPLSRIIRTPKILEQGSEKGLVLFALTMLLIDHR